MATGGHPVDPFSAMTWEEKLNVVEMIRMAWFIYPTRCSWRTFPIDRDALARLRSTGIDYDSHVRVRDLGVWCYHQRMAKIGKGGFTLTDDQLRKLNSVRFDWNPSYDMY
tara:strand:- start:434 stop:763 length:330 start_codon:yes stop_codon:yes gene_type:complete